MTNPRPLREPREGDLIYIKRPTSGVLVLGDPTLPNTNWSQSILTIEPNQTALVLKSYSISPTLRDQIEKGDHASIVHDVPNLFDISKDEEDDSIRYHFLIIIAIGEHVVETLFDPDYLDVINSSDSTHLAR